MIEADIDQLQVVLSAVFTNASEAGAERIHIRTGKGEVDEAFTAFHQGIISGDYVLLTIEDTGRGVDEETKTKYSTLFSTKFQECGLDMVAVYSIVKNHNGYIYVDCEPGKVNIVRILTPPVK